MNDIKLVLKDFKNNHIKNNVIMECLSLVFVILCNMNIYLLIIWLISILITFIKIKRMIKNTNEIYNNLTKERLRQLNKELKKPLLIKSNWIMLDNYIIIQTNKFSIINYEDIILMYYKLDIELKRHSKLKQSVIIITKNKLKYKFTVDADNDKDFITCSAIIREKNPNVLEEKNIKNKQIIKEKYNIDIK